MIYVNPLDKKFDREHEELTKMQIDNSLRLHWSLEDILLITNFPYEYNGVTAIQVKDYAVFDQNRSTKIPAINELFERNSIGDDTYWFHDHDAFQLVPFDVALPTPAGFTDHGWSQKWNAGSFFFTKEAQGIFRMIEEYMNIRNTNEQDSLTYLWEHNIDEINQKCTLMNITYNINIYHIERNIKSAGEPPKVAHFHPHKKRHLDLFRTILPRELMDIYKIYGIE